MKVARRDVWTSGPRDPTSDTTNYVLALLLPPLSIMIAGRPIVGLIVFMIWIPAIIVPGGVLTHPLFIVLAWFIIFQQATKQNRRN